MLPAARGRAAAGFQELLPPSPGDRNVCLAGGEGKVIGWVVGGGDGKSVTSSTHRAFCPSLSKEHPGRGPGYSLPTWAGWAGGLQLPLGTRDNSHLPLGWPGRREGRARLSLGCWIGSSARPE